MRTRSLFHFTSFLLPIGIAGFLTGCYTQLYTRGYGDRARDSEAGYAARPRTAADTLYPADSAAFADSSQAANSDSTGRMRDENRSSTVIVNNYYEDPTYYRGYSTWDWEYPYISFGYSSSRYRDYWDPYWWHGSGGRGYNRGYDRGHNHGSYVPNGNGNNGGGTTSGPYHSDKRLFTPAPDYPELQKGRRSKQPDPQPAPSQPAPKSNSNSNSGSDGNSNSGGSNSGYGGSQSGGDSSGPAAKPEEKKESHPDLQKGRRR